MYSTLSKYLKSYKFSKNEKINILETGTALGFSSLCMAKALSDQSLQGLIVTIDPLPNEKKIYWNIIDDFEAAKTRLELLKSWEDLVEKYILYLQGESKIILPKLLLKVHFAFLDAAHTFSDVIFEYNYIKEKQLLGDIIVFDDYNKTNFPGLVRAIDTIEKENLYNIDVIEGENDRNYVIAYRKAKGK